MFNRPSKFLSLPLLSSFLVLSSVNSPAAAATDIAKNAKWEQRLVVQCAEDSNSFQGTIDWAGFAARDLWYVSLTEGGSALLFKPNSKQAPGPNLVMAEQIELMTVLKCKTEQDRPRIGLFGKDGGLKKVWSAPPTNEALFNLIDSMPMRQQEMRDE